MKLLPTHKPEVVFFQNLLPKALTLNLHLLAPVQPREGLEGAEEEVDQGGDGGGGVVGVDGEGVEDAPILLLHLALLVGCGEGLLLMLIHLIGVCTHFLWPIVEVFLDYDEGAGSDGYLATRKKNNCAFKLNARRPYQLCRSHVLCPLAAVLHTIAFQEIANILEAIHFLETGGGGI